MFKFSEEEYFIEPLEQFDQEVTTAQAHAIFKRPPVPPVPSPAPNLRDVSGSYNRTCGLRVSLDRPERQRQRWEQRHRRTQHGTQRRLHPRSVSSERWVETLVVADHKMVEYHGSEAVEGYVLAVMNIDDLKITHHADQSLNSFCKWQKGLNMKGDDHPLHHDVAVLLTRKDICASVNSPCETLGLSHVAGMCQPHRSCSISEDTGLPLAFTVAHELGHNFGIQHDGSGNDCEPVGKRPFVMSPQLLYGTSLPKWSSCSRQYITRFLDRGWGWCLDDLPGQNQLVVSSLLPGVLYSAPHQCRLQYGSSSTLCQDMDWCVAGQCVSVGQYPERVDGGWAAWSQWSTCTRTCGSGVQSAHRDCTSPLPRHRGKYCLGERRRYRVCNPSTCPQDQPSFRDLQCGHFNSLPYKGQLYSWVAVYNRVSPCELHCRPLHQHFSEKMRDAVTDGTPCYEGSKSRDMCVNGICKDGCDLIIDSSAEEDRCGVCNGNGSTCATVKRTFDESKGLGVRGLGLIPEGSWDIRIEEVAEAGNFLLLFQESNPGVRYEYTINQNASAHADPGAARFYWKLGSWSECSVTCGTGVQKQAVHCVQRTRGIVEEHLCDPQSRPQTNQTSCNKEPCPAVWWMGEWQTCSSSCGPLGVSTRSVLCVQSLSADDQKALQPSDCEHMPKPESASPCNTHVPCPSAWSSGNWSQCSVTCGGGTRWRNISCTRNTGADCDPQRKPSSLGTCQLQDCPLRRTTSTGPEAAVLDQLWPGAVWRSLSCSTGSESDCDPAKRPAPAQRCYLRPCSTWKSSPWSKCSRDCGGGVRVREVQCFDMRDARPCDPSTSPCNLQPCLDWYTSSWGQCSEVCGGGQQQRIVTCPEEDQCDLEQQPDHIQTCNSQPCAQWLTGSWGQCSASCGGGLQHRLIKCVDTKEEPEQELEESQCSHEQKPASTRKCQLQECSSAPSGQYHT
ncbi:hypothetical protein WMY93_012693 [Mugilogobius chulae]|uniref:Peptidase M12B domain-containing protein n=1 Tax=Mugilogobius chulae TaxID=88201 RepID=A0AAW0P6Y8_9GOBI